LRVELATALIRGLPKQLRTQLVPAPDTAARAVEWLGREADRSEAFWLALGRAIQALTGVVVPPAAWAPDQLDDHLRVRFRITRPGAEPATGRDLTRLAAELGGQLQKTLNRAASHLVHPGATDWAFGDLPERIDQPVVGIRRCSTAPIGWASRSSPGRRRPGGRTAPACAGWSR